LKKVPSLPILPEHEKTPIVKALLGLFEQLIERVQQQNEEIALLKDDINILKGEKKRPVFVGSKLDKKMDAPVPPGSRFKGYRNFVVQDLSIGAHTTRYRLEYWVTPDNKAITEKLPDSLNNQHFGPQLIGYILYQYHHCQTTQPL
jgi:hypothetical protein